MMDVPWLSHLIIFIMVSSFGAKSSSPCPANQFLHPDGICCEFCPIGLFMYKPCQVPGSRSLCFHCNMGTSYMDKANNMTMCKQCSICDPESEVEERKCHIDYNRLCVCREGFHRKGNKCGMEESTRESEVEESKCTFENNRQCVCREGFQKKANKCELEKTTRAEPVSTDIDLYQLLFWILLIGVLCVILFSLWRRIQKRFRREGLPCCTVLCQHFPVSRMNLDEDTKNLVTEVMTPLISMFVRRNEHNETDAVEKKLSIWRRKYAVHPTIDLNSANQRIVISSDHSMAIMGGIDQQYPKHPHRFTSCKQVLAKESFLSGRYYWEVDVTRAHEYEIGIASQSMLRIGGGWECSLGWNVNSWCVAKHAGKYTARHDGFETNLNMLGDPRHLGLCLDCDQGDLVIYAIDYGFSWPMHTFYVDENESFSPALRLCNVGDALRFLSSHCYEDNYPGMLHL